MFSINSTFRICLLVTLAFDPIKINGATKNKKVIHIQDESSEEQETSTRVAHELRIPYHAPEESLANKPSITITPTCISFINHDSAMLKTLIPELSKSKYNIKAPTVRFVGCNLQTFPEELKKLKSINHVVFVKTEIEIPDWAEKKYTFAFDTDHQIKVKKEPQIKDEQTH